MSRDDYFLGLKYQNSTFCMRAYGFHIFWLSFFTENTKFLLASMKSIGLQNKYSSGDPIPLRGYSPNQYCRKTRCWFLLFVAALWLENFTTVHFFAYFYKLHNLKNIFCNHIRDPKAKLPVTISAPVKRRL